MLNVRSTSTRTFVLWPVLVAGYGALRRRPLDARFVPMALAGFALYRGGGVYRTRQGGGGPGMSVPPERLVTSGPYALTRNPMYLGHLVALFSYAAMTRSRVFAAVFGWHVKWFDERAVRDEQRLVEQFGEPYERYRRAVPRWIGPMGGGGHAADESSH